MTTIDFARDFLPYRERAAAITAAIIACEPGALDEAAILWAQLDDRFTVPLTELYEAIPAAQRYSGGAITGEGRDAIWKVVDAFAGVAELSVLRDIAMDWADPDPDVTGREREIHEAGARYRELFPPAPMVLS